MIETILQAIKKNQIENYLICREEADMAELYFIKKELDMRRLKKTVTYEVTIYHDFLKDGEPMRGFSTIHILPEMDEKAIEKAVADAYYAAAFVNNPKFPLPEGKREAMVDMCGAFDGLSLEEIADAYVKGLYEADCREDAFINSAEFFVNKKNIAIRNSNGVDVSYTMGEVKGEFIVQCRQPQDVELYQSFSYGDFDTQALTRQAKEALDTVCARAHAKTAPDSGTYDVILSGEEMYQLFSFYMDRACCAYIYPGYSNYKPGMQVQGEAIQGEKVNLTLKALEPYSEEGIAMKDLELIHEGELKAIYGNTRFSYYLKVKPTGYYHAMQVENGTKSMEELTKEPYLHVVSFSAFSMDSFSGYFGGEIRLAYLYDGEKVTPVTGGSVNGNFIELQKNMVFSKERYKNRRYEGPMAVRFCNVPVAGV